MINLKISFFTVLLFLSSFIYGQTSFIYGESSMTGAIAYTSKEYTDCAAIFYNGKMLVNEYERNGKCKLAVGMKGKLTLSAVTLTESSALPTISLSFRVAIKHGDTNTLWMYTEKAIKEVLLEDILKECKEGDKIIFLTEEKKYSLPHHEIDVLWGC